MPEAIDKSTDAGSGLVAMVSFLAAVVVAVYAKYLRPEEEVLLGYVIAGVLFLVALAAACHYVHGLGKRRGAPPVPATRKSQSDPRADALRILKGDWIHQYVIPPKPEVKERARIDFDAHYFVEIPGSGYTLDGPHKYDLHTMAYDQEQSIITFTKIKPGGGEPKPETLEVLDMDHLKGYATGDPSHTKTYTRTVHDMEAIRSERGSHS